MIIIYIVNIFCNVIYILTMNNKYKHKKIKENKLTYKYISHLSKKFNRNRTNKVFKNANTKDSFKNIITKADYLQNKKRVFKNFIDIKTNPTDQKHSGRCWLFAFLNVIRIPMIKKYHLEDNFEFSQNFLFFYDKLEKANYFFNFIIKNKNLKFNDLKLIYMLDNLTNDGGQWNMFVNLINKYGIIPKTNMDDHFHSKDSFSLNSFYNDFLRKSCKLLRETKENKENILNKLLEECYKILVIFLGEPPKTITWQYYKQNKKNKSKKYKIIENIRPIDFFKKIVPYNINNKICLINYPCNNIPYYNLYNVDLAFNVVNGINQNFINVPIEIIINCVKKSIDNKEAVWCGIDVDKYKSKDHGFLDEHAFNYKDIFNFTNKMEKCDSLNYRQSYPSHAVVIRGYNLDNENIKNKGFLIENSWGDNKDGFNENLYMNYDWFKDYLYMIVIDKKFVSKKELNVLKKKPILLPYWSPFGSLLK